MYPGDQTADCTRMLCAFRDEFHVLRMRKQKFLASIHQMQKANQRFIDKNGFPFELIIDVKRQIARTYDSVMLMGFIVKRTVIAINKEGKVVFFKRGYPTNDEILSALHAPQTEAEAV